MLKTDYLKDSHKTDFIRCLYTDGEYLDYDFVRICKRVKAEKGLTFDERFLNPKRKHLYSKSPFREISHASVNDKLFDRSILPVKGIKLPINEFAINAVKALKEYFKIILKKDRKYLIFHSAGFDSRLMSLVLMELRDEGFNEFPTTLHFRCHQPEGPMFIEIMERQGWDKSQYSVYEGPDENYYHIGRHNYPLNGWQKFNNQMNFWHDIVPEVEQKDWYAVAGLGGEIYKYLAKYPFPGEEKRCSNELLSHLIEHNPNEGEWESLWMKTFKDLYLPFFSYEYLKTSLSVDKKLCMFDGLKDSIRMAMVETYIKSHNVDCLNIKYGRHDYSWNLTDRVCYHIQQIWKNSKFAKRYWNKPIPNFCDNLYDHNAYLWGFMTAYEAIYEED